LQRVRIIDPPFCADSMDTLKQGTSYWLIFGERVVGITVKPAFLGLSGGDDWMPGCVRVFAGVTIWRAVAAERHTARLARTQVDPG